MKKLPVVYASGSMLNSARLRRNVATGRRLVRDANLAPVELPRGWSPRVASVPGATPAIGGFSFMASPGQQAAYGLVRVAESDNVNHGSGVMVSPRWCLTARHLFTTVHRGDVAGHEIRMIDDVQLGDDVHEFLSPSSQVGGAAIDMIAVHVPRPFNVPYPAAYPKINAEPPERLVGQSAEVYGRGHVFDHCGAEEDARGRPLWNWGTMTLGPSRGSASLFPGDPLADLVRMASFQDQSFDTFIAGVDPGGAWVAAGDSGGPWFLRVPSGYALVGLTASHLLVWDGGSRDGQVVNERPDGDCALNHGFRAPVRYLASFGTAVWRYAAEIQALVRADWDDLQRYHGTVQGLGTQRAPFGDSIKIRGL